MSTTLLDVKHLCVDVHTPHGPRRVVSNVSFTVQRGEAVGLVGESGSGKSMTAFAVMNLFPSPLVRISSGEVWLEGRQLSALTPQALRAVRGARVGMVFQDPSTYLDPLMPVGRQIAQTLRAHGQTEGCEARVLDLLNLMELAQPARVARQYPHELSGGMRQRILIAAALAMKPALLIADEPTTALDVTVQAGILRLLVRLRQQLDLGSLLITHDLAVVAQTCQRVNVMYAGELIEQNQVAPLFATPRHPYTQGLLRSVLNPQSRASQLFFVPGSVPTTGQTLKGCRFHPRCPIQQPGRCDAEVPALIPANTDAGLTRCHLSGEPVSADAWQTSALPGPAPLNAA